MTSRGLNLVVMEAATNATCKLLGPTASSTLESTFPFEECEVVACDTEPCDGCSSPICQDCLKDGMCEHCRSGWADTRAEYGIESDDDCGDDPYGY